MAPELTWKQSPSTPECQQFWPQGNSVHEVSGFGVSVDLLASPQGRVSELHHWTELSCWEGGCARLTTVRPVPTAPVSLSPSRSIPGISNAEARQPGKAPNFSVNWTVGDSALEVINATTGKDELGRASRLCKHALYCRWMRVHGKVLPRPPLTAALPVRRPDPPHPVRRPDPPAHGHPPCEVPRPPCSQPPSM